VYRTRNNTIEEPSWERLINRLTLWRHKRFDWRLRCEGDGYLAVIEVHLMLVGLVAEHQVLAAVIGWQRGNIMTLLVGRSGRVSPVALSITRFNSTWLASSAPPGTSPAAPLEASGAIQTEQAPHASATSAKPTCPW